MRAWLKLVLAVIIWPVSWLGWIAAKVMLPPMVIATRWLAGPLYVDGDDARPGPTTRP